MYTEIRTKKFRKAINRLNKSGSFDCKLFEEIVDMLLARAPLPTIHHDHSLKGNLMNYRECHIKGDLILIYLVDTYLETVTLVDMGSHSSLFRR